jgi:hypothetical protein
MIGNDIIDLTAIQTRGAEKWRRYRQKIMSAAEQNLFAPFQSDQLDIWLAWTVKESVYKLEYQLAPQRYFAPKQIHCLEFDAHSFTGIAQGRLGSYPFFIEKKAHYIHALAWLKNGPKPNFRCLSRDDFPLQDHLIQAVAEQFPNQKLQYQRWPFPAIILNGKIDLAVSMSHHGELGAYAF